MQKIDWMFLHLTVKLTGDFQINKRLWSFQKIIQHYLSYSKYSFFKIQKNWKSYLSQKKTTWANFLCHDALARENTTICLCFAACTIEHTVQCIFIFVYRISANSFRGKYSFLNLTLCTVTFCHCTLADSGFFKN